MDRKGIAWSDQFVPDDSKEQLRCAAVDRILMWDFAKDHVPTKEYTLQCRSTVHASTFMNQLDDSKSQLHTKSEAVIMCPLSIRLGGDTVKHDHSKCEGNRMMFVCPDYRGNHFVALVIDTRSVARELSRDSGGRGVIYYFDPLGHAIQNRALKQKLFEVYPKYYLYEMKECVQTDGIQCAIWTSYFFSKFYDHVISQSRRFFTFVGFGVQSKRFGLITPLSTESDREKNQRFVLFARDTYRLLIANIRKDENLTPVY